MLAYVATHVAPPVQSGIDLLRNISANTRLLPTGCDR